MKKISIIVPVYNVEKYLSTCLHSCIHQTLYDIEIICVNDGSTDNSLKILEQFSHIDPRIIIINKPNGGLSSARNVGIKNARGKYLMFLDSDDFLSTDACERVWRETLETPTDIVIFGTNIFPENPKASDWYYNVLSVKTHRRWGFSSDILFKEPASKPFVWRQAYNKKFFFEHNLLFNETVKYGEDILFQMQAFPHGANFSFISDSLYTYRWYREGSLMHSVRDDLDKKIENHLLLTNIIAEYWQSKNWLSLYGKDFTQWMLEFTIPDIRCKDVKYPSKHLANLRAQLQKYDLEKYLHHLGWSSYSLVRTLKRKY